jgi:hypothetical protein
MKFLSSTTLLFLISLSTFSQTDSITNTNQPIKNKPVKNENKFPYKKSSGVSVINANPIGQLKAKNLEKGGFALPGWGVSFDSRNHLGYGFSFISYSSYAWIGMDDEGLAKKFTEDLGNKTKLY